MVALFRRRRRGLHQPECCPAWLLMLVSFTTGAALVLALVAGGGGL